MSLSRTPPNEAAASASILPVNMESAPIIVSESEPICQICNNLMTENDDCLNITNCNHSFHRSCIEYYLSNNTECPICKRPCELVDLKKINPLNKQNPSVKQIPGKRGRGAMAKRYNTRSHVRNLFQESQRSLHEFSNVANDSEEVFTPGHVNRPSQENSPNVDNPSNSRPSRNARATVDYEQLNKMIENNLTRLLTNLNLIPNANSQPRTNRTENIYFENRNVVTSAQN
ncbi:RING-H2 finger protein ATL5-like [Lucilia sericata]|uniref:RING-H2 finger protein ATL5-like n=1 Tax=Lucilia sericata TaxID=13632 RepID=UPI0018A7ED83|nr:RING-H2 finger protein ATL5-like [Lucilia sericata]